MPAFRGSFCSWKERRKKHRKRGAKMALPSLLTLIDPKVIAILFGSIGVRLLVYKSGGRDYLYLYIVR